MNPATPDGRFPEGPERAARSEALPPGFGIRAAKVLDLTQDHFQRHFLERFLEWQGWPLRLPWWAVHLNLYVATALAVFGLVDLRIAYPGPGRWSLGIQLASEFLFTTFMLWQLRQARLEAFVVVAELGSGPDRLQWMRRYLAPFNQGWYVLLGRPSRIGGTRGVWLRPWHLVVLLLALFYGLVVYYALRPAATDPWQQSLPQILLFYPQLAKAAMVVAVGSHFWWLAGISQVANGAWPSDLSSQRRAALRTTASQAAWRLSVVAGLSTGFWMFAYGLTLGVTCWAWVLSGGLFATFVVQTAMVGVGRQRRAVIPDPGGVLLPLAAILRDLGRSHRPLEVAACLLACGVPPLLNRIGPAIAACQLRFS